MAKKNEGVRVFFPKLLLFEYDRGYVLFVGIAVPKIEVCPCIAFPETLPRERNGSRSLDSTKVT